eukprot:3676034-Rhodomonas_salina.1
MKDGNNRTFYVIGAGQLKALQQKRRESVVDGINWDMTDPEEAKTDALYRLKHSVDPQHIVNWNHDLNHSFDIKFASILPMGNVSPFVVDTDKNKLLSTYRSTLESAKVVLIDDLNKIFKYAETKFSSSARLEEMVTHNKYGSASNVVSWSLDHQTLAGTEAYSCVLREAMNASNSLLKTMGKESLESAKAAASGVFLISELVKTMLKVYQQDAISALEAARISELGR